MIEDAERKGILKPGGTIIEATGGNTAIALAMIAAAKGYKAIMVMPGSIAREKIDNVEMYGATAVLCPGVPFSNDQHYFHTAARMARQMDNALFTNQFDNDANFRAHYEGTAPEIWK